MTVWLDAALTQLMTELRYWRRVLRQAQGRQINAHLTHQLAHALGITAQPRPPMDTIQEKIGTLESQLRDQLGDPNCCEKWLEGLALAQTAVTGGNYKK